MTGMQCPQCGAQGVIQQPLAEDKKRAVCSACGWSIILDKQGRKQLLEVPPNDSRRLLTETIA